jgi:capsular polysaccharide biosynthesis protein/cellulose biosynthesis protein BcsQ
LNFRTFVQTLMRHWMIAAAALVACLLGAGTLTLFQNKAYESSATLMISISGETSLGDLYQGTMAVHERLSTYAAIAGGPTVAERAVTQLHVPISADALASHTQVKFTPKSALFTLTVRDSDPKQAAALAGAMADQFAAMVPTLGADPTRPGNRAPAPPRPHADGQQDPEAMQLESAPGSPVQDSPAAPPPTASDKPAWWPVARATVMGRPGVPTYPVSPLPRRNMALGLIAGLILGIAVALTREAMNRTVRRREELEQQSDVPTLGELPGRRGDTPRFGVEGGMFDEAMRSLRAQLLKTLPPEARRILVTSPFGGEGTTMTALNLATAFTELGERVLLVEGDPRRSVIANLMHITSGLGLADVLIDRELAMEAVQPTSVANLFIVASRQPRGSATLPCSTALPEVLEHLSCCGSSPLTGRFRFDRMVVDAPAVLATADTGLLAGATDATVLVVRAGRTAVVELKEALHALHAVDADVVGTVLTAVRPSRHTKAAAKTYRAKLRGAAVASAAAVGS